MRSKILSVLLSLVCAFGFTGCALFEHNYEKDYQQVIVEISPVTETYNDREITTKAHKIYKSELVSLANNNLASLVNSGYSQEDAINYLVDQLVQQKLLINEADFRIQTGEIEWGMTEDNAVLKTVYATIDSELKTIRNEIRSERGESVASDDTTDSTDSATTTYPVPETEEADETEDTEVWVPDEGRVPGKYGTDEEISLDNEAMRRLLELFRENIDADFRLSSADRKAYLNEIEELFALGKSDSYSAVYLKLGEAGSVDWLIGESARDNQKITLLQEYLTDSVSVTYNQVSNYFSNTLKSQKSSFADLSSFNSAVSDGSQTILYYPSDKYLYVKHILIPFSDAQTAEYTAWKNDHPEATKAQKEAYRAQMVNGIKAYAHVEGEDDKSYVYSAQEIFTEVKAAMASYEATGNVAGAEKKFEEFIYKFNTDPGIFDSDFGYAVAYELDEGESETYMTEFAEAARAFRDDGYSVGQIYDEMVVTDYGVHIMYYAKDPAVGEVKITDRLTPGSDKTYYDLFEEELLTEFRNARFNNWLNERILYYENLEGDDEIIHIYSDRFEDLIK